MDINYAAGFFDAEGCIGIWNNSTQYEGKYFVRRVQVTNSYRAILEQFEERFGGRVVGPRKGNGSKKIYEWIVGTKRDILYFLEEITPYLQEKRPQAEVMMAAIRGEMPEQEAMEELFTLKGK